MTGTATIRSGAKGLPSVAFALLAVLAWTVGWYWPTVQQVTGIWWSYDTFAHGLVVFPISAWLIWHRRHRFAGMRPEPVPWMAIPVLVASAGWLVAELITVNALAHLSLMSALVIAFVGMLGFRLAKELAFPLGFLFFGVPIGEFLTPMLMDYTAVVTVWALRLVGIPVYQDGLFFVIPSGRWSVVEACSGIRYLIASLMVGTLFAYLNYTHLKRRLIFVGVAIIVPIVANWMRAFIIVMIGHLSDNKLAAGVDHLLYGWVFFGIVIGLMFWIGAMWREDEPPVPADGGAAHSAKTESLSGTVLLSLPIFVALAFAPIALHKLDAPLAPFEVSLKAPEAAPGWSKVEARFFDYMPRFRGERGLIYQTYEHDSGGRVALFVAYYAEQRAGSQLVTSSNRLNFRDDDVPVNWQLASRRPGSLSSGDSVRTILSDRGRSLAFWHWYWSNDAALTSEKITKIQFAINRLTGQADDSAFVAVLTPTQDGGDDARPLVEAFLRDHREAIDAMLGSAKATR